MKSKDAVEIKLIIGFQNWENFYQSVNKVLQEMEI